MSIIPVSSDLDPQIKWDKIFCQVCQQPSGPCSKCYEIPKEDQLAEILQVQGNIVSLYNKACYFRSKNMWKAHTNFPVSAKLLRKLESIPGADCVLASSTYSFTIVVGSIFDEEIVKKQITAAAKVFIKEKQALFSLAKNLSIRQQITTPQENTTILASGR